MSYLTAAWKFRAPIAAGLAILFAVGWLQARDARIRQEAVAEERLADFEQAMADLAIAADSAGRLQRALQAEQAAAEQATAEAERLRAQLATTISTLSTRAVEAGQTVQATLDSIMVAETLEDAHRLAQAAQAQMRRHVEADRALQEAHWDEMSAADEVIAGLNEQLRIASRRFATQGDQLRATERALDEARSAIGAQVTDGSWTDHWTVRAVALAGAAYAGYRVGSR